MPVFAAMGDRKPRRIAETIGRAMHNLSNLGQRTDGPCADAGHEQKLRKVLRTTFGGSDLMIYRARVVTSDGAAEAGSIVGIGANPIVRCGEGALKLLEVQAPGRKRMRAGDWARGRRLAVGDQLGDRLSG